MYKSTNLNGIKNKMAGTSSPIVLDMTQLLLLGKVEYGGGPIFKVAIRYVNLAPDLKKSPKKAQKTDHSIAIY